MTTRPFNADNFDGKMVAGLVNYISDYNYISFAIKYHKHLEYMYDLSGLDCGYDTFCYYVYNNSDKIDARS